MLHLVIISVLGIYHVSAQRCGSMTLQECIDSFCEGDASATECIAGLCADCTTTTTEDPTPAPITTTEEPTPAPTCAVSSDCSSIRTEECCDSNGCTFTFDDSCVEDTCEGDYTGDCANYICGSCAEPPTPEPTPQPTPSPTTLEPTPEPTPQPTPSPTTLEPTPSPTCPVTTDCTAYSTEDCCVANGNCLYLVDDECVENECEGNFGGECAADLCSECSYPTPVPTPEPTTLEPTPEPTPQPTPEPTTSTTTAETTETTTTITTTTSATTTTSRPTSRPTMKSAMKWEMIHPAYTGGDGELLWHIYYGDYSQDERFDAFRKKEMWDADAIRPIIENDIQFSRFRAESNKFDEQSALVSDGSLATKTSYGTWFVVISLVLVAVFAYWYKNGCKGTKAEYQPLLQTENVAQYSQ